MKRADMAQILSMCDHPEFATDCAACIDRRHAAQDHLLSLVTGAQIGLLLAGGYERG